MMNIESEISMLRMRLDQLEAKLAQPPAEQDTTLFEPPEMEILPAVAAVDCCEGVFDVVCNEHSFDALGCVGASHSGTQSIMAFDDLRKEAIYTWGKCEGGLTRYMKLAGPFGTNDEAQDWLDDPANESLILTCNPAF